MFLDECFERYGVSESFVNKISRKKSSDVRNKDFQVNDVDDLWDIVLNFVKQRQDVFVDINHIVFHSKWFYDILSYQSKGEVDVTKTYFGDYIVHDRLFKFPSLHKLSFYKFFEYEGELFAFRIILEKQSEVLSLSIEFGCRTEEGCAESVETIIYDAKDRCWDENYFGSQASLDFLEIVLKTIGLFADDFESSCIPQLPKNFHRLYWEDEYNADIEKISTQLPMTSAIKKVLKQKGIF